MVFCHVLLNFLRFVSFSLLSGIVFYDFWVSGSVSGKSGIGPGEGCSVLVLFGTHADDYQLFQRSLEFIGGFELQ